MFINKLLQNKYPLLWVSFHILLGFLSTFSNLVFILFFYFIILDSLSSIINLKSNTNKFVIIISYIVSFEVFGRILNCSPWIPYEISKYFLFIVLIFALTNIRLNNKYGPFLLLLLIPSIFFDNSGRVTFENFIFNFLGPINLVLGIWFFSSVKFDFSYLFVLFRLLLYPLLSTLILTLLRSPDLTEANFILGANNDFTGGFGSNQVSTIYGIGVMLLSILIINKAKFSGNRILDIVLLILFFVMALLSFSRGGVFGGILGLSIYLISLNISSNKISKSITSKTNTLVFVTLFILSITFFFINNITQNSLLLRYKGETSGTLKAGSTIDLNKYTTGRFSILEGEFELFSNNLLGVGVGASQYLRTIKEGAATHTELGRLIAEHGILGLIFFIFLLFLLTIKFNLSLKNYIHIYSLVFIVLAIFTSFHAATRTYVTPLYFGLGMLIIYSRKIKNTV